MGKHEGQPHGGGRHGRGRHADRDINWAGHESWISTHRTLVAVTALVVAVLLATAGVYALIGKALEASAQQGDSPAPVVHSALAVPEVTDPIPTDTPSSTRSRASAPNSPQTPAHAPQGVAPAQSGHTVAPTRTAGSRARTGPWRDGDDRIRPWLTGSPTPLPVPSPTGPATPSVTGVPTTRVSGF